MAHANQISLVCSAIVPGNSANGSVVCPQFDQNGVLTLVTLTLVGRIDGSVTLDNNDPNPESGVGNASAMFVFGPLSGFQVSLPVVVATAGSGNQPVPSKSSQTSSVSSGNSTVTDANSTNLAPYTGSGSFGIPVSEQTTSNVTGTGNFGGMVSTSATATADVSYTFNASDPLTVTGAASVPEPGTWLLTALALAAMVFAVRRRAA